jgi:hypothetical protein
VTDPLTALEQLDRELEQATDITVLEQRLVERARLIREASALPPTAELCSRLQAALDRTGRCTGLFHQVREQTRGELTQLAQLQNLVRSIGPVSLGIDCEL